MTKNCWNSQALAEISCYLAFAGAMLYLVRSGRYLSYVTPKLAPYLCFSAAVMVVWALSSLGRVFRIQYRKHIAHCFVLAIPLLLLLLPHDTVGLRDISDSAGLLNGSMVSGAAGGGGGIPATGSPIPSNQEDTEAEGPAQAEASADGYTTLDAYGAPLELHGYNSRQQTITVSNEEFYDWLCVFYTDIEQLEGFQVTMTGQVYKNTPVMADNEFVPARLVMACCVADLSPCGLFCTYGNVSELESDSWVTVTGILYGEQYKGQEEPRLRVTSVVPAIRPDCSIAHGPQITRQWVQGRTADHAGYQRRRNYRQPTAEPFAPSHQTGGVGGRQADGRVGQRQGVQISVLQR